MAQTENRNLTTPDRSASEGGVFAAGMNTLTKSLKAVFVLMAVLISALLIWFFTFSGFFVVKPDTAVITLRFGEFKELYTDSWHWVFPYPVSSIIEVPTCPLSITSNTFMPADERLITDRKNAPPAGGSSLTPGVDGYLLTADACILHTSWMMTYRITNPKRYYESCMTPESPKDPDVVLTAPDGRYMGTRGPRTLLRNVLDDSVIRVTASWNVNDIIFSGKSFQYVKDVESLTAKRIADLDIGVSVETVSLTVKSPPPQTIDAFDEVLLAEQQGETEKKKAEAYAIEQSALAQSESTRILAEADNYKTRVVAEVEADAVYFKSILEQYRKNPSSVTVALFSNYVSSALENVKDKFILNALPQGRQELRLKLNPEPAKGNENDEDNNKQNGKEAGK